MRVVDRCAAPDAILASDSGTVATWSARHFDVRGDRQYLLSANLATIAAGVPYAIAAQWAHPRPGLHRRHRLGRLRQGQGRAHSLAIHVPPCR
jgi:thiamine pyrophosphate-dependent acetolactate synthase large subunit-like protein